MLGADWTRDAWTAGLLVSWSKGEGSDRGEGEGEVSSTLTGVLPYGRYAVSDWVTLWGECRLRRGRADADAEEPEYGRG